MTRSKGIQYRGYKIFPCAYLASMNWYIRIRQGDRVLAEEQSPQFDTLAEAREWIHEQIHERQFLKGTHLKEGSTIK